MAADPDRFGRFWPGMLKTGRGRTDSDGWIRARPLVSEPWELSTKSDRTRIRIETISETSRAARSPGNTWRPWRIGPNGLARRLPARPTESPRHGRMINLRTEVYNPGTVTEEWTELIDRWQDAYLLHHGPADAQVRTAQLARFAQDHPTPFDVDPMELEDWIGDLELAGESPAMIGTYLATLAHFYGWAKAEGLTPTNPARRIPSGRRA